MNNVPVALFVYNRPQQLVAVLDCLKQNQINSLYIFSDGPKNDDDQNDVQQVRNLIKQIDWLKPVVFYSQKNLGLKQSLINGINEVFNNYDEIIVIEDDICVEKNFFKFASYLLKKYKDEKQVAGITGFRHPFSSNYLENYNYDVFFHPRFNCWGWATWKDRWQQVKFDKDYLSAQIEKNMQLLEPFGCDMKIMYSNFQKGKMSKSWAIYFALNMLIEKQVFIYPTKNLVENLGMKSGSNFNSKSKLFETKWEKNFYNEEIRLPNVIKQDLSISEEMKEFFIQVYQKNFLKRLIRGVSSILTK